MMLFRFPILQSLQGALAMGGALTNTGAADLIGNMIANNGKTL